MQNTSTLVTSFISTLILFPSFIITNTNSHRDTPLRINTFPPSFSDHFDGVPCASDSGRRHERHRRGTRAVGHDPPGVVALRCRLGRRGGRGGGSFVLEEDVHDLGCGRRLLGGGDDEGWTAVPSAHAGTTTRPESPMGGGVGIPGGRVPSTAAGLGWSGERHSDDGEDETRRSLHGCDVAISWSWLLWRAVLNYRAAQEENLKD